MLFRSLRRNPDLKWRQSPAAVQELMVKQQAILASAARLLRPGGRLVYATCSLLREENEAVAQAFEAQQQGEFARQDVRDILAAAKVTAPELPVTADGDFRAWPHRHAMDGFFAAVWERKR